MSRATVFHYFPTKESIVFGDAPQAIAALAALLDDAPEVVPAVREWLRGLTGWIEPDLQLQRRLAREVPDIAAHRLRVLDGIQDVVAEALARELGAGAELAARLAAAALIAGFDVVEDAAADRMDVRGARARAGRDRRAARPRGRVRARRDRGAARGLASADGGACTAPISGGLRSALYSRIAIWIAAATGIASSAPMMPNSVAPNNTEVRTMNGWTCTACAWIRGWITLFSICW